MIIVLDSSFDALDDAGWRQYLPAIGNLISAHVSGWHIFAPSRRVIERLCTISDLARNHRTILSVNIGESIATLMGYVSSVKRKIVCFDRTIGVTEQNNEDIYIALDEFIDLDKCLKSRLIIENPDTDGAFYISLANILTFTGAAGLPLAFDVVHGGGDTTARRVRDAVQEVRPLLIIVDGDKAYPACSEGETARKVREEFNKRAIFVSALHVTPVKSAENFIPIELAPKFLDGRLESVEAAKKVAHAMALDSAAERPPLLSFSAYINYKKGIKIGSYRKGCAEFRSSVDNLLVAHDIEFKIEDQRDVSRDKETLIGPVNGKYIELFIESLNDNEFKSICRPLFSENLFADHLVNIVDDIVAFGVAFKKLPFDPATLAA